VEASLLVLDTADVDDAVQGGVKELRMPDLVCEPVHQAEKFNLLADGSRSFVLFVWACGQQARVEKVDVSLKDKGILLVQIDMDDIASTLNGEPVVEVG
jgi:hypothetical protein